MISFCYNNQWIIYDNLLNCKYTYTILICYHGLWTYFDGSICHMILSAFRFYFFGAYKMNFDYG